MDGIRAVSGAARGLSSRDFFHPISLSARSVQLKLGQERFRLTEAYSN